MSSRNEDRTAHWGSCEDDGCGTAMVIYPHSYAGHDLPDTDEWDDSPFFIDCPVCGGPFFWGGTDHPADIIKNY